MYSFEKWPCTNDMSCDGQHKATGWVVKAMDASPGFSRPFPHLNAGRHVEVRGASLRIAVQQHLFRRRLVHRVVLCKAQARLFRRRTLMPMHASSIRCPTPEHGLLLHLIFSQQKVLSSCRGMGSTYGRPCFVLA